MKTHREISSQADDGDVDIDGISGGECHDLLKLPSS